MSNLLIPSFLVSDVSKLLRSLTKNERPWANRSGRLIKMSELLIRSFFRKKKSDSLRKPKSEFPALPLSDLRVYHACRTTAFLVNFVHFNALFQGTQSFAIAFSLKVCFFSVCQHLCLEQISEETWLHNPSSWTCGSWFFLPCFIKIISKQCLYFRRILRQLSHRRRAKSNEWEEGSRSVFNCACAKALGQCSTDHALGLQVSVQLRMR